MASTKLNSRSDISDKVFGELTATSLSNVGPRKGGRLWLCSCSCGITVLIKQKYLLSGNTKSCGHLKALSITNRNAALAKDLTEKSFGDWTVLQRCDHRDARGAPLWVCRCVCGTVQKITSTNLLRGRTYRCAKCRELKKEKRLCVHGHDTDIYGRDAYGYCKACVRDRAYRRTYGITLKEYEEVFDEQRGECAICGVPLRDHRNPETDAYKQGDLDHDHSLKGREAIRGILCGGKWQGCNYNLGHVDDLVWLEKAVVYLKNPPAREGKK